MTKEQKIETLLAQAGNHSDTKTGSINVPIYLSTTFQHPTLGESTGYDYTRTCNPTRDVLQDVLADLEGGIAGFATSSGMAAVQLVLNLFPVGSHIVASRDLYGGSFRLFDKIEKNGNLHFSYADQEADFKKLLTNETVAFFVETPTNPLMNEVSLKNLARLAKQKDILLIVDNTFYSPVIQRPLEDGADIVLHSATKYLGGHNDLLAGAVITNRQDLADRLAFELNTAGAVLAPFDCWLLIRGLKTLALRVERAQENARKVVAYLEQEKQVKAVFYSGRGGMISFKISDATGIKEFLRALNLITFAESLGGVESLITYPTTQTHADIPREVRESYGLTDDLLRLSIGIENVDDLILDLQQAFAAIK